MNMNNGNYLFIFAIKHWKLELFFSSSGNEHWMCAHVMNIEKGFSLPNSRIIEVKNILCKLSKGM